MKGSRATAKRPSVMAVLPAYNAARTLERTVAEIPRDVVDDVLLVDDASTDGTADLARRMGLRVLEHDTNRGYGANQKTCYREALLTDAEIVVMLHPDYQYDGRVIGHLVGFIELGICDVMLGSRIRTREEALRGRMPIWKYLGNRALTLVENIAFGQNLGEFHSGLRAYSRQVLERVPFQDNDDGFVFDSQFLAQAIALGFRLGDVPVPVRYHDDASSVNLHQSVAYGIGTLATVGQYCAHRLGIPLRMFGSKGGTS